MTKTEHSGIYHISTDTKRKEHKFVIRQTITIQGIGKKTVKETYAVKGVSYKKALERARDERPFMRERAKNKIMGIDDKVTELDIITLDEIWTNYVLYKSGKIEKSIPANIWSTNNIRTTTSLYNNHIAPVIGHKRALQVAWDDVDRCISKIRAGGLSARMEKGIISALRPLFTWWYKKNKLRGKPNPATDHELRGTPARQVKLTNKQREKLFKAMYSSKDERFRQVWIWLSTGRRVNEVLSLRVDDVSGDYYTLRSENNKVRKPMIYRVPTDATIPDDGYVHTSPRNEYKMLTQTTVDKQWNILRAVVGLPNFNKHDIRHLVETELSDSQVPQAIINKVMGHLEVGAKKHYQNDTTSTADLKNEAVQFFLDKVFNRIPRDTKWDKR